MTSHARARRNTTRAAAAIVLGAAATAFVLWRLDSILASAFSSLAWTAFSFL
ncbi:MAG: hypothetical protein JO239_08200 [Paraburkholderia sp.]|nr:hypothetical protein [Paraburkholderia sp.]